MQGNFDNNLDVLAIAKHIARMTVIPIDDRSLVF